MSKLKMPLRRVTSVVLRYGLAVVCVAIALGLALLAQLQTVHNLEFPLFLMAIAVTVWYAGAGPGVLALVLSGLSFDYFFTLPLYSFDIGPSDRPYFVVFILFAFTIGWFSSRRRRIEQELRQARDELETEVAARTQQASLLNLTHDTIFVRDMNDVITYWNRGAQELYGWTAEEAIGKRTHQLLQTVFPVPIDEIRAELLRTGRWEGELEKTKADGTQVVERIRAQEALRASELKFRSVVESASDGIILADSAGTIIAWNKSARAIFGYDEEEVLGQPLTLLMPERYRDPHRQGLERFRTTGKARVIGRTVELHGRRKNGSEFPLELSLSTWNAGERTFYGGIIRDITERKRTEGAIRQLNEDLAKRTAELEAMNKELEAFAYSISHDLRAPLRHMVGYTELLQKNASAILDEKSQRYTMMILESAKRMGNLIDDLLAFSRIGRTETKKTTVSLEQLVQETLSEVRQETDGRNIVWNIGALPDVYGDRSMLRLALVNLISNAIKFTRTRPQAEIEIGCADGKENEIVIFIRDNGVGFEMKYVNKLFGVFQRLHRAEEFEGTGIGLASVQRIIHRHGGRVWAEGLVDRGATFYFSVPKS